MSVMYSSAAMGSPLKVPVFWPRPVIHATSPITHACVATLVMVAWVSIPEPMTPRTREPGMGPASGVTRIQSSVTQRAICSTSLETMAWLKASSSSTRNAGISACSSVCMANPIGAVDGQHRPLGGWGK